MKRMCQEAANLRKSIAEMDGDNPKNWPLIARMSASLTEKENAMETFMLPNGVVVSRNDLEDILVHADIRTELLTKVIENPMTGKLLLQIMKELEYKPGYQEEE